MKNLPQTKFKQGGFTAVEMVVSTMILAILGIVFIQVLNSGMVLYAKNTAVNSAHEEAREGINRLTRDIHASISAPQLRAANADSLSPSSTTSIVSPAPASGATAAPMAAGISFQDVALGPQYVWKDPSGNGPILVKGDPSGLTPGLHLVSPLFNVEDDVVKVTATPTAANHHNVWLTNSGESLIANKVKSFGTVSYSIIYYTSRMMYLVKNGTYIADSNGPWVLSGGVYVPYTSGNAQRYRFENGELHLYQQAYNGTSMYWKDTAIVARNISSPTPFYIPLVASAGGAWYQSTGSYLSYTTSSANSTGQTFNSSANTKYVGVKLTARDPKSSNRGYLATASLLNTQIDYRSRIADYQ